MGRIVTEGGPFEVFPGERQWAAGNAKVGVTIVASEGNTNPSKRLNNDPALAYVQNEIMPFSTGDLQKQTMIAELNGIFLHVQIVDGKVCMVMADKRLT